MAYRDCTQVHVVKVAHKLRMFRDNCGILKEYLLNQNDWDQSQFDHSQRSCGIVSR